MDLDKLQIQIVGDATDASKAIDRLVDKLGNLSGALSNINSKPLADLSKNVRKLSSAMSDLGDGNAKVKEITSNLSRMNNLNLSGLSTHMNSASASMNRMSKSGFSLAASFGRFYASYWLVVRGIKGLWGSIEKTADYMESLNYYTVAFNKISSEWQGDWEKYGYKNGEEYSKSFMERMNSTFSMLSGVAFDEESGLLVDTGLKNLGLNIKEVTQFAAQLASVTNSVGQTGEVSLATADAFTKLAADMSSLTNQDYSVVANHLQSGLIGQSRALYKYGIDITNATLQTYAYENGLEKAVSEMTQAEKMQLRILAVLDQAKVAWGDQANTINSLNNGIRMLKNNLSEASMTLGQLFVPLMSKIIPIANGATIAIKNLMVSIAGFMGIELDKETFGKSDAENLEDYADGLDDVADSAKKANKGLRGFDELKTLSSGAGASANAETGLSFDLTEQIQAAAEEYNKEFEEAHARMVNLAEEYAKKISVALEPVKTLFKDLFSGDWTAAGEDVSKLVIGIETFFSDAIEKVDWGKVGENIGDFLSGIEWETIIKEGIKLTFDIGQAIADAWFGSMYAAPFETAILTSLGVLKFTGVGTSIATKIGSAFKEAMGTEPIKNVFMAGFEALYGNQAAKSALTFMTSDFVKTALTGLSVAIPITISLALLKFEWEVGKERDELEKNIDALGEDVGRKMSGNDPLDKIALYRHDQEKADAEISDAWDQIFEEISISAQEFGVRLQEEINNRITKIGEGLTELKRIFTEFFDSIGESVKTWFKEKVKPWLTKKKWQNLGDNIKNGISAKWTEFLNWWDNTGIKKWYDEKVAPWLSKEKWITSMNGVKEAFQSVFNNAANAAIDIFNKLIKWINQKMSFSWDGLSIAGQSIIPAGKVQLFTIPEIPKFQIGGFPEDGLFMANHNELVGKFSNGRTAVANNDQITRGIADAVYPAVYNAVTAAYANKGSDPIKVFVGDRELTDIVVDGINQRTRAGKQPLFGW